MSSGGLAFDDHVVHIHFYVSPDLVGEYFVHHPLVGCPSVLQSEWHDYVEVNPSICDESRMLLVFWHHLDLVVP